MDDDLETLFGGMFDPSSHAASTSPSLDDNDTRVQLKSPHHPPKPLDTGRSEIACDSKLGRGTLVTLLRVVKCCSFHTCQKRIQADFYFVSEGEDFDQHDFDQGVGYSDNYYIDKAKGEDGQPRWLSEVLSAEKGKRTEFSTLPHRIYNNDGTVKDYIPNDLAEPLQHYDKVGYIATLQVTHRDKKYGGLGTMAVRGIHEALKTLDNGYAFEGMFLLWPSLMLSKRECRRLHIGKDLVARKERGIYFFGKGGYEVLIEFTPPREGYHSAIMVRRV